MQILRAVWENSAFLGIPDIEILDILSAKCKITQPRRPMLKINEQSIESKSNTNKNSDDNPGVSS